MSAQRKYYLAAASFFCIGAVLAIIDGSVVALVVFVVLAAMMFWIQSRVDRFLDDRQPGEHPPAGGRRDR